MSVRLRPAHTDAAIIKCDRRCPRRLNVHPGPDRPTVRAVAAGSGWSTRVRSGKLQDICPGCGA